jgi:alpha-L-arabinofuranosidase
MYKPTLRKMRSNIFTSTLLLVLVLAMTSMIPKSNVLAATDILFVNSGQVLNDITGLPKPLGINTNYLMDDDHNRSASISTSTALSQMGAKYLRYPGGDKSDSYLWSVAPYDKSTPTLSRTGPNEWPSADTTLMQPDMKTYKIDPLDFDEFMTMSQTVQGIPVLVVNFDSAFKPAEPGGTAPTFQDLKTNAVEWVRYANIVKGYGIKYWEIGNESYTGSSNGRPTTEQYADGIMEFSTAMKAVDPTIKIGANGGDTDWWQVVLGRASDYIDFLAVHEYPAWEWKSYDYYKNNVTNLKGELDRALYSIENYASPASRSRLKVAVTEMNSFDWSTGGWNRSNNLGHALVTFDTFAQYLKNPKVLFTQVWNTRWIQNNTNVLPDLTDALKKDNTLNASGSALSVMSKVVGDKAVRSTETQKISSLAFLNNSGSMNIALVNKDTVSRGAEIYLENFKTSSSTVTRSVFGGTNTDDINPVYTTKSSVSVSSNKVSLTLDPNSVTILNVKGTQLITNLVSNPSFEQGIIGWDNWGNASVVSSNAKSGSKSVRIGTGAGGQGQELPLQSNKSYTCSINAKLGNLAEQAWVGVTLKNTLGQEIKYQSQVKGTSYVLYSWSFTTPPNLSSTNIWSWKNSGSSYVYSDVYTCK